MRISLLERNGFKLGDKVEIIRSDSDEGGAWSIIEKSGGQPLRVASRFFDYGLSLWKLNGLIGSE